MTSEQQSADNPASPMSMGGRSNTNHNSHYFGFGALDPSNLNKSQEDSCITLRQPSNKF
jgi:hypothetical protein